MKYLAWIIVMAAESKVPDAGATPPVATGSGNDVAAALSNDS
jgi:hypothetical protein